MRAKSTKPRRATVGAAAQPPAGTIAQPAPDRKYGGVAVYTIPLQERENLASPGPEVRLLTINEAAKYLNCHAWFIRTQVWSGALPYVKFGKRYLFDKPDLDALVDRQKVPATA